MDSLMPHIRRSNLDDLETIIQLRLDMLREVGNLKSDAHAAALAAAIRHYLARKMPEGKFLVWVAETSNRIVGIGGLCFFERPPVDGNLPGLDAYVMNMYTVPEWRGKGVATALLGEIVGFVKGTEARRIWLHAAEDGRRIYSKAGFASTTSEMELVW